MSNGSNRILDELAKLMTDVAGATEGIRYEAETFFRSQIEKIVHKLDLVSREEFEVMKEMLLKLRAENTDLIKRLDDLEKQNQKKSKTT
ncbi:hypothetical protein X471_00074 [Bartonella bacilliformis str. Heidi Mejia]|uniref:Membrane fusogenic activity n=2 Tax=Bartonella bacilliformis TaxID=774 RepID=A1UTG8_BARBK|nr:accessory factor UbiK family protein [Bartonella bacilliformis]ABM44642.1 conserved hypothetical protein [Bartonella bacilliformis KC583]AMG86037.1 hypothetical protein AL467_04720 [Bartonella bacilliformis]EKS43529.1 hypothetical protein BbINS_04667 [Bartonella bacilliformis INS]EYS89645.1 hypothetical protein X472_00077 [Bartonella bacilliformis San Pedro600-02]EYS92584.1 hypothetical protein X471_00074 [Bartonella bacilliformis str. Heidi Mejia]